MQAERFYGKFPGFCRDNNDPMMVGRIRAEVPYPLGKGVLSVWALPCLPPGHFEVPKEGDGVWIEFAYGDINQPIWTGIWYRGKGNTSEAPFQEVHEALTDFDGADVEPDRNHTADKDPVGNKEHKEFHDHAQGQFYTPHRRVWRSETGHHLEWNDHPGKGGYVRLYERFGRVLEMTAKGIVRLRSYLVAAATGNWQDLNGTNADAAHEIIFADYYNEDPENPGQFIQLKDMAGGRLRMNSTPGDEYLELRDFWGQYIRVHSVKDGEYLELVDKAGQKIRLDASTGTVLVQDQAGNFVELKDGQVTVTSNGHVTVNVPDGSHVHIGGPAGQELATKQFVQNYFNTHTHSTPAGPSGPPLTPAPLTPGADITKKQKSE